MPLLYEEINIRGTLNMMEASRQNGVKKFVYASSSSVYGASTTLPKKEGQEGADPEQTEVTGVLDFTEDMKLHFTTPENPELEKTAFAWERERPVHIWMWNAQ